MAQLKQTCAVTNGSQQVTLTGDVTSRIKQNSIFMVEGLLVPYTVAADSTFDGTKTTVTLAGAYAGVTNAAAAGVFVTDFTYPDMIPTIAQGDVGTAAVFTQAMYRVQDMINAVSASGLSQYAAMYNAVQASAANVTTLEASATASKNAAATSAGNAAASATAAAQSATNAATSETNALNSANTASAAAASVAQPDWNVVDTTSKAFIKNKPTNVSQFTLDVVVDPAHGGTGVNNGTKTITLGGNLATSGAFASTFTMTGTTAVTFPTSGTLLSTAAAVTPAQGGTGLTAYTVGDLVYASGASTLAKLADVATGNVLLSGGVGAAPSYGKVDLTAHVTGAAPVANGGTGATTAAAALTNLGALPIAGGTVTGNFGVNGTTWLGGATQNYNGFAAAVTVNYTGSGSQYGMVLKPSTSTLTGNAITFLKSTSTYSVPVQLAAIEHIGNDGGMNLGGTWTYQGSAILNAAGKDGSNGIPGLNGYSINLKNAAGTITSQLVSAATSGRTWTFPDKTGTLATTADALRPANLDMVYGDYAVPPATYVPITLTSGATMTTGSAYRVTLVTQSTGTYTGTVYVVTPNGATWTLTIVADAGETSNNPLMRINVAGTGLEIYHNHASQYSIRVLVQEMKTGNAQVWPTVFGLEGLFTSRAGVGAYNGSTLLHAANFNTFAPTLTGTGASGSWAITAADAVATDVTADNTTNAIRYPTFVVSGGTAKTHYASDRLQFNPSTGALTATSFVGPLTGNATTATTATNLSGFTNSTTANPINGPDSATQNGVGYVNNLPSALFGTGVLDGALYAQAYSTTWVHQIYGDYRTGQIAIRGKNNGTWQAWRVVLDDTNFNTYAPKKDGTGASGNWGINAATATKLAAATTINGKSFDGSAAVTLTTSDIAEGTNLYYTDARTRAAVLTGLSTATNAAITATDTVLSGMGKLQAQISGISASSGVTSVNGVTPVGGNVTLTYANIGTVPVANGGTGATTASAARTNLGAAASGANGDITSLTGLTTAFTLPAGCTAAGLLGSANNGVAAAGTTQATATVLTTDVSVVTSGTGGVVLPAAVGGKYALVVNKTGAAINVYPASTHAIDSGATNAAISLPAGGFIEVYASATGQWYSTTNAVINGGYVVGNIAGNAANVTGTVAVANGGTGATTAAAALTNLGALASSAKDASGGVVGMTGYNHNLKNAAGTVTSQLASAATVARTYTMPDKDGTVAMTSDIPSGSSAAVLLGSAVISSAVVTVDFLNIFSSAYNRYVIEIEALQPSTNASLIMYLANGGVIDSGNNYYSPGVDSAGMSLSTNMQIAGGVAISGGGLGFVFTVDIRNANGSSASSPKGVGIRGFAGSTQIIREGAYRGGVASGFRILPSTGTLTAGSVFVYGFKNS